jgi:hypothetical protein
MFDRGSQAADLVGAAARIVPTGALAVATAVRAIDPQWVIAIPAAALAVLQIAHLLWKWRRDSRKP